ncbi:MAG TPA: hypothetical protein PK637_07980 [Flavobacteriales bacterium]|nr:hypothetical protein [Flavobacteriales bacterium]HRE96688.1 hypothetical protein [Flavobacteriales bacterium]HRJ36432.1 hypothetical protein [Flavobacteriales bacterium]HRJ39827.1 hypothetical protein [Flavobacteriales bacterium]
MNKWIVPSILSLSLLVSCAKPKYRSEEGGFAVSFKGIPQENTENVATAHGDIAVTMFLDEVSPDMVYLVGYSDYPEAVLAATSPEAHLMKTAENVAESVKGTLSDVKKNSVNGFPSLDFRSVGNPFSVAYRLIIRSTRMYQVGIMKQKEAIKDSEIQGFIETFEILE